MYVRKRLFLVDGHHQHLHRSLRDGRYRVPLGPGLRGCRIRFIRQNSEILAVCVFPVLPVILEHGRRAYPRRFRGQCDRLGDLRRPVIPHPARILGIAVHAAVVVLPVRPEHFRKHRDDGDMLACPVLRAFQYLPRGDFVLLDPVPGNFAGFQGGGIRLSHEIFSYPDAVLHPPALIIRRQVVHAHHVRSRPALQELSLAHYLLDHAPLRPALFRPVQRRHCRVQVHGKLVRYPP